MNREWKPGDVAMIRTREYGEVVGIRTSAPVVEFFHVAGFSNPAAAQLRPLVVIDPENREQVAALCRRYVETYSGRGAAFDPDGKQGKAVDDMQAALRSLVEPPKPEQPRGVGAVVMDVEGNLWVRLNDVHWYSDASPNNNQTWGEIAAVSVLSQGVEPLAEWERDILRGDS